MVCIRCAHRSSSKKKYNIFCNQYYEYVWSKNRAHTTYYYASQVFGALKNIPCLLVLPSSSLPIQYFPNFLFGSLFCAFPFLFTVRRSLVIFAVYFTNYWLKPVDMMFYMPARSSSSFASCPLLSFHSLRKPHRLL